MQIYLTMRLNSILPILFAVPLIFFSLTSKAQFSTPAVDATLDAGATYPNNYVSGATTWYTTWNNTDLFVFIQNANESEPVSIYLDVDPIVPVNGGNNSDGTLVGLDYDGYTTRPNLPFRADICIYAHNGYREIFRRDGANGWTSLGGGASGITGTGNNDYTGDTNGQYSSNDNGNGAGGDDRREFRISWSRLLGAINGGARPTSFNWMGYHSYNNGMYAQVPVENYNGGAVTSNSNGIIRYFTVSSTANGSSTNPFGRNSFTQPLTATNNSFGAISAWDFTMNSSGQQIARLNTGGNWTIGGTLVVNNGTVFFGSGGSGYGSTSVGNVDVRGTGSLNMDATNQPMLVNGDISVSSSSANALVLSSVSGGDLDLKGNFSKTAGTFSCSNRQVQFSGTGSQTWSSSVTENINFLLNSNTGGTLNLNSNITLPTSGNTATFNASSTTVIPSPIILLLSEGTTLTANSSGTTLTVNGTLRNSGITGATITSNAANIVFGSVGIYDHNPTRAALANLGIIPTATWNSGSTCLITGLTSPTASTWFSAGADQTFSNFTWNTTALVTANTPNMNGASLTADDNFTMTSTNLGSIRLGTGTNGSINCGSFIQTGGIIFLSVGIGTSAINCGNFSQSLGTINFSSSSGSGLINCTDAFNKTGGTLTRTVTSTNSGVVFNGTSTQSLNFAGTYTNNVNFTFNNANGYSITGTCPINTSASLTMMAGSFSGVGAITYSATATTLIYANPSALTTSNYEWPTTLPPVNLTINGADGVSLHASKSLISAGVLNILSGVFRLGDFDFTLNNAAVGAIVNASPSATRMIATDGTGFLRRLITSSPSGSRFYPIGDETGTAEYSGLNFGWTANSAARIIGVRVVDGLSPNMNTPSAPTDYLSRYFIFSDNIGTGTYAFTLNMTYNVAGDVSGTESNLRLSYFNGTSWSDQQTTVTSPNLITTSLNQANISLDGGEISGRRSAANTYDWNAASGTADWQIASNWTPSRTAISFEDILTFTNGGTSTANNIPAQIIGQLKMSSGTTTTLVSATGTSNTLTLIGGTGTDLDIPSGCSLTIGTTSGTALLLAYSGAGHTADVSGTLNLAINTVINNTYTATNAVTTVSGTLTNGGLITSTAINLLFSAASNYTHTRNGGAIPLSGWNASSTCTISGVTSTDPTNFNAQTFGNLIWNPSGIQTVAAAFYRPASATAGTITINGNLQIVNTGSGSLSFITNTLAGGLTLTVAGDLDIDGGSVFMNNGTSATSLCTINLAGNYDQSGGTFLRNGATAGIQLFRFSNVGVNKTFTLSAGTMTNTNIQYTVNAGAIVTLNNDFPNGAAVFTVSGTLHTQDKLITGTSAFTMGAAGTLGIGSAVGISSSGATGNIRVTGIRTYIGTANYIYNGTTSPQSTGNGLGTAGTLTINNTAVGGIVNQTNTSITVTGLLTLTAGTFNVGGASAAVPNTFVLNGPAIAGTATNLSTTSFSNLNFGGTTVGLSIPSSVSQLNALTLGNVNGISLNSNIDLNSSGNALVLGLTGRINLGNYDLKIASATGAISGTLSASNMILTPGSGQFKKTFGTGASGIFVFPIGETTGVADYSPFTLTFTANSLARTIGVNVTDGIHPSNGAITDYASRFWSVTDDQLGSGTYSYSLLRLMYSTNAPSDVLGTIANYRINRFDGSNWIQLNSSNTAPNVSTTVNYDETNGTLGGNDWAIRSTLPTSYTWVPVIGTFDFQDATQWSPQRFSPQTNDILQFTAGGNSVASNVPTQTIAQLIMGGSTTVALVPSASNNTLTLSGTTATDLDIPSGCSLTLGQTTGNSLTLAYSGVGNTAAIAGTFNIPFNSSNINLYSSTNSVSTISGTFDNGGTVTSTALTLFFTASSNYNHTRDGGAIPTANWNATSTCTVSGVVAIEPTNFNAQSFGNLTWNPSSAQTVEAAFYRPASATAGAITINGNLEIVNTGSGSLSFVANTGNGGLILTINGDLINSGADVFINNGTAATSTCSVNLAGNYNQSGGTFSRNGATAGIQQFRFSNAGINRTFDLSGGTMTNTNIQYTVNVGAILTLNDDFPNAASVFTVAGTLFMQDKLLTGTSGFTLSAAGTLGIGALDGIAITGSTGNVRVTGVRTYNAATANFIYNGAAPQITGAALTAANNLTINNGSGVTLSLSIPVTTGLILSNGKLDIGSNNITMASAANVSGASATNYVITSGTGQFICIIPTSSSFTYNFPIGDVSYYSPVSIAFSANSIARNLGFRVVNAQNLNDLTLNHYLSRCWLSTVSVTTGTYAFEPSFSYNVVNDVTGTEAIIKLNRWNGSAWFEQTSNTLISSPTISTNGTALTEGNDGNLGTLAIPAEWAGRIEPPVTTYTWVGLTSNDFNTATNWSPVGIPYFSDIAVINSNVNNPCIIASGTNIISAIQIGGNGDFRMLTGTTLSVLGTLSSYSSSVLASLNCSSTISFESYSAVTIPAMTYGNLECSNGASRIWTGSATTRICGSFSPGVGIIYSATAGSTVDYNGSGSQTITPVNYFNLSNSANTTRVLGTGTIDIFNVYTPTTGTVDNTTNTSTINFSNTAAQTIPTTKYGHITNSGNGNRTFATSGANGGIIEIFRLFTPGTGTFTSINSTVKYTGNAAYTLATYASAATFDGFPYTCPANYFNLIIDGPGGTWSTGAGTVFVGISNNLTITNGTLVPRAATTAIPNTGGIYTRGDLLINGGNLNMSNSGGAGVLFLHGDLTISSGVIQKTAGGSSSIIFRGNNTGAFFGLGNQIFTQTGGTISGVISYSITSGNGFVTLGSDISIGNGSFTVNSANFLNTAQYEISGTGNLTLNNGCRFLTAHPDGVSLSPQAVGAIRLTGFRNYNFSVIYIFNGTVPQLTGDGFPFSVDAVVINNPTGVTCNSASPNVLVTAGGLVMNSGHFILGTANLTFAPGQGISGASSSRMIITNGTGFLRFQTNSAGLQTFTFPLGDNTGTDEYTPATLTFNSPSAALSTYGLKLVDGIHPNMVPALSYISRYFTGFSDAASNWYGTFNYTAADIVGAVASMKLELYNAGWSTYESSSLSDTTMTVSSPGPGSSTFNGTDFTGRVVGCTATASGGGDWNNTTTWASGAVPGVNAQVCINDPVTITTIDPLDVESIVINAGGSLSISSARALTFTSAGILTNNSGVSADLIDGTVVFGGDAEINGTNPISFQNVVINDATMLTTAPTIKGNLQINLGAYVTASPLYASTSTLIYNSAGPYLIGNEWTGNSTTAGTGNPQNISIQNGTTVNMTNANRGLAGNMLIASGTLELNPVSGDLFVGGNWTRNPIATFTDNSRAVFFNGSGTQTIAILGAGTESFSYLRNNKSAGMLQLSNSPATNVSVTGSAGTVFGMLNTAGLDLNGQTFSLNGTGGNFEVSGGINTITGASGSIFNVTNGVKTITNASGGSLNFDIDIVVLLNDGVNFGTALSTIDGTLRIGSGGFVTGNAPYYSAGSVLNYANGGGFGRGTEWSSTSGTGYPHHVEVDPSVTLDLHNGASAIRQIAGNLLIKDGGTLNMNGMTNPLVVLGNVTVGAGTTGTLSLGSGSGGDIRIAGDFIKNSGATLNINSRDVTLNGTSVQQIGSGIASLPYLTIDNAGSSVQINTNFSVENRITLNNGSFDLNGYSVTLANNSLLERAAGTMTTAPTISGADVYDIRYYATLTAGAEFINSTTAIRDLIISSGTTATLSANVTVNRDLKLAGDVDLGTFIFHFRGNNLSAGVAGNLEITSGARTISGSVGSIFDLSGFGANNPTYYTKTVTNPGSGTLNFGSNVLVRIGDGRTDFGTGNPVTINGILQVILGGSVYQNSCYYGVNSILRFANTVDYQISTSDKIWASGSISSGLPGIPWNLEINDIGTDLQLQDTRALRGNLTTTNGTFTLTPSYTGSFNIGGNWTRTGATSAFTSNSKKVIFDKQTAGNQIITVGSGVTEESFYDLELSLFSGDLQLGASTNVTSANNLNFISGRIDLVSPTNTLTIGTSAVNGSVIGFGIGKYIISNGGLVKVFTNSNTAYNFPLGDDSFYTPFDLTLTNGGQAAAFITGSVTPAMNTNLISVTDYITRYWTIEPNGLAMNPDYNVVYTYAASDLVGLGSSIYAAKFSSSWIGSPESGALAIDGTSANHNTGTRTFTWNGLTTFSEFTGAGGTPLPISLIDFHVKPVSAGVEITWVTASEINNHYFTIERSADAVNYTAIGKIDGAGNSTIIQNYSLLDADPLIGISYYRLRQTDYNGTSEVFDPQAVNYNSLNSRTSISVYPNPASDLIKVSYFSEKAGNSVVEIIDIAGRVVYSKTINSEEGENTKGFDISNFEAGKYLIKWKEVNGVIIYSPFVIVH